MPWATDDRTSLLGARETNAIRAVVTDWAHAHLNALLNHVYFETEPMIYAKREELLDFSHIMPRLEEIPFSPDKTKLRALQQSVAARAPAYSELRVPRIAPDESRAPIRAWADEMQLRLSPGHCTSEMNKPRE